MALAKIGFYRQRVAECDAQLESVTLANIKEKIIQSRNAWAAMADAEAARENERLSAIGTLDLQQKDPAATRA
ncbi:hypothetical protein FPY71_10380 [Aureimonas fodinaquatilis]|uniref:Uncharacterized protein n=1 Tax=Aureimonas fodinaquatilis TaxID=2565783 RepID=A0A5B0DVL0_9HYPH|nr:hypothetical protein [Aureimonas fodinaquatilis]KAA0970867.1 hypothetical protein FPY71_10380 [Aureimonas fodinaquatilis]